ncbi:MAG: hypothetical protein HZA60_03625 [Deltaproteobacteria bacterium]|nr:hypothetical protein [Deltaproteobacteria bacterium]
MISFFSRQIDHRRRGNAGQAAVLFLTTICAILALVFATIHTSHLGLERIAASNAVDAIALSAATWEARGLNLIAALNDGILQCFRVIRWICIVWASLAVAACFGAGMPAFSAYSQRAPRMIRSYWKTAKQLEEWSVKVKNVTPYLVLAETAALAGKLKVTGALYPCNPRGPHDGESTLELHLKPGPPLLLVDALGPITSIPARISKWKWAKKISRTIIAVIDTAIRPILGIGGKPIRMLEPEEDFPRRQNVRFAGYKTVSPLPIPYLNWPAKSRFLMEARGEPFGGGTMEMTWGSRLIEKGGKR